MAKTKTETPHIKQVFMTNRKAYHDYAIGEKTEVGIVLVGSEVKSIREGQVHLDSSYVTVINGELWLNGSCIPKYKKSYNFEFAYSKRLKVSSFKEDQVAEFRKRKLLCHKKQILDFKFKTEAKGYTIVPLKIYETNKGKIKLEIGLAKGKNAADKRSTLKEKAIKRDMER